MKHDIIIYTDSNGKAPLREYIENLKQQNGKDTRIQLNNIQDYINLLQERGTQLPQTICKHFSGRKHSWLWELRAGKNRVLFTMDKDSYLILHAFKKKSQKTPKEELERAEREYSDWTERNDENE